MRHIFILLHGLLIGLGIAFTVDLFLTAYDNIGDDLVTLFSLEEKRQEVLAVFTEQVYHRLQWTALFLTLFYAGAVILLFNKPLWRRRLAAASLAVLEYPRWVWRSIWALPLSQQLGGLALLSLVLIQRLILSQQTEVIYDEAWTWQAFTSKNPLLAFCFYPSSNNHILFSHLTQLTKNLPFDILFNLRLAAMLPNLMAVLTFFLCIRKYAGPFAAWMGSALFAFAFPMVYYGFVARGYSLLVFFFVIGFFSVLQIIEKPENFKAWSRLTVSTLLGAYTIPTYLYPGLTLFGFTGIYFLLRMDGSYFFKNFRYGLVTGLGVLLLYLPVFTLSGVASVMGNEYVTSQPLQQVIRGLGGHLQHTLRFFSGTGFLIAGGLLLAALILTPALTGRLKNNPPMLLSLFCLLMVPALILIHRILPVERTWIYLMVPLGFFTARSFTLARIQWLFAGLLIPGLIYLHFHFEKQNAWYDKVCEEDYHPGKEISRFFHYKKALIITDTRMNTYLRFNREQRRENWEIWPAIKDTVPYKAYYIHYQKPQKEPELVWGFDSVLQVDDYRIYQYQNP